MRIEYHKKFTKRFSRLSKNIQSRVIHTVDAFRKNTQDPTLKNHPLKGTMLGKRTIKFISLHLNFLLKYRYGK